MRVFQSRAFAVFGFALFALLGACTAGDYEVSDCDDSIANLSLDACNKFNTDPNDCMPYQCERSTGHCVQAPRDYDRDGDPDSRCGGTDCYDQDPTIKGGPGGACSCSITGNQCSAGQGACKRFDNFACKNNVAVCPAVGAAPMDWQSDRYNDAPHSYTSEDWNCDGNVEHACCYMNSNNVLICQQCMTVASVCTGDLTAYCSGICSGTTANATACSPTAPKMIAACDAGTCGSRVVFCYCTLGGFLNLQCVVQNAVEDRLRCR